MGLRFLGAQKITYTSALTIDVPLTMSCWFNPTTAGSKFEGIAISDGTTTNEFEIQFDTGTIRAMINNSSNAAASLNYSAAVWQHACAVFASTTSRAAYLNGRNKGTNATSGTVVGAVTINVGAAGAGSASFTGKLAEVGIWNVDLNDTEVAELAKGVKPYMIRPANLVFYRSYFQGVEMDGAAVGTQVGVGTSTLVLSDHPQFIGPRDFRAMQFGKVFYNLVVAVGTFVLSGKAAAFKTSRKLVVAKGTFTLSGIAAAFKAARKLVVAKGTFTLTGRAALLTKQYKLALAKGTFTLTGIAAAFKASRKLAVAKGTFTLTGIAARLAAARKLAVAKGTFTLSGKAVNFVHGYTLALAKGTFILSGKAVTLVRGRHITAAVGAFVLSGKAVAFKVARKLALGKGTFVLTGIPAHLVPSAATYTLPCNKGTFLLTGNAATLTYTPVGHGGKAWWLILARRRGVR